MKAVQFVTNGNGIDSKTLPDYIGDFCTFADDTLKDDDNNHLLGTWELMTIFTLTTGQNCAMFQHTQTRTVISYGIHIESIHTAKIKAQAEEWINR